MKDMIGNELAVGQKVAWGAGGRCHGTRIGHVTELCPASGHSYDQVRVKAAQAGTKGGLMYPFYVVRVVEPQPVE